MTRIRVLAFLCLASAILLACSLPGIVQQTAQPSHPTQPAGAALPTQADPTQTATATRLPTATSTQTQTPTPTASPTPLPPTPTATPDLTACLAGTWEPVDLSPFVIASLSPDLTQKAQLTYKGTSGHLTLTFLPDHKLILHGDDYRLLFDAKVVFFTLPVEIRLNGVAAGAYSLDGKTLTTHDMDVVGLSASAKMAGKDLIDPAQILNSVPLLRAPYNTAGYTCSGDTLLLKINAYPNLDPLELKRVP